MFIVWSSNKQYVYILLMMNKYSFPLNFVLFPDCWEKCVKLLFMRICVCSALRNKSFVCVCSPGPGAAPEGPPMQSRSFRILQNVVDGEASGNPGRAVFKLVKVSCFIPVRNLYFFTFICRYLWVCFTSHSDDNYYEICFHLSRNSQ